jgi:uncharacterized protein YeaO (DUF488 family)
MPNEIRIWSVADDDKLQEIGQTRLNFEARLEDWLDHDISLIDEDLIVIGRQVETDAGGYIDLLCLDSEGDLAIVELKRDKTPRDIVAQTLEYASWIVTLSGADVLRIAERRFTDSAGFARAFRTRYDKELPESINSNHRMIIVASEVDGRCERVINYLSERHGVNINAVTFQHFGEKGFSEYFARVFLIEPNQAEYRNRTQGSSKRLPNLSFSELEQIADERGVGKIYKYLVEELELSLSKGTTRSSIAFKGLFNLSEVSFKREDRQLAAQEKLAKNSNDLKSRRTIISLIPGESSTNEGLYFQAYSRRIREWTGKTEGEVTACLPADYQPWSFGTALDDWDGYQGYIKTLEEAGKLIALLAKK